MFSTGGAEIMISVAIKYPLLFLMAIVIAGVVDEILAKLGIPRLVDSLEGF